MVILGDWDADGVVSAAELLYAQRNLGLYPIKKRCNVMVRPVGPRSIEEVADEILSVEPRVIALVDIPFTTSVGKFLREAKSRSISLVYIDHHLSTIFKSKELEKIVDELIVGKVPTALLVYHLLKTIGARLTPRLEMFVRATGVIERSKRPSKRLERLVRIVVDISKALTHLREEELWRRLVEWLASPLAFSAMPFSHDVIERIRRISESSDKRLKELATELAPTAHRIFNLRLVDARGKLRSRGGSALASMLYRTFRSPVAVIVETKDRAPLLIIRGKGALPYRIALVLVRMGIVEDAGGHQSLALLKLRKDVDINEVESMLRKAMLEVSRTL